LRKLSQVVELSSCQGGFSMHPPDGPRNDA
jgi:hypothetical protein